MRMRMRTVMERVYRRMRTRKEGMMLRRDNKYAHGIRGSAGLSG
jgi:hypothetical protein